MGIIKAFKLGFDYLKYDEDGNVQDTQRAVNDVNLDIEAGQFVAVLGHNGSGKSTLAKHLNALLLPTEGTLWVDGIDTSKEPELWKVRQKAGMVFQNPDNQIIGTVVEEDVGFGPENMGVPTEKIWERVDESLKKTGMHPIVIILRINFPADRSRGLQLPVSWQCVRNASFWMSQLQCWIRMDERKFLRQSVTLTDGKE